MGTHTLTRVCVRGYVPTFISTYSINLLTCTDLRNHRHRLNYKTVLLQRPLVLTHFPATFCDYTITSRMKMKKSMYWIQWKV